uniref:SFRICE_025219 n=1 Tax=Spodoptera frugiperda TaxID=7108 RepID=A0A2H1VF23_SPOFR
MCLGKGVETMTRFITKSLVLTVSLVEWSQLRLAGHGVSDSIPGSDKVLLSFFVKFSVVARSLELWPVYGNWFTTYYMCFYNTNGENVGTLEFSPVSWVRLPDLRQ